jgi:hypothetical protein
MMAPRQVIVVEGAESFEKLGEKSRDDILKALGEYLDSPAPFTVLLLEASALDGRQRFYKLLQEKALVVELSIGAESAASLAMQMAKELGAEIDREAATLLADILNGAPARIRIELEKLTTRKASDASRQPTWKLLLSPRAKIQSGSWARCWQTVTGLRRSRFSITFCAKASSPRESSERWRGCIAS